MPRRQEHGLIGRDYQQSPGPSRKGPKRRDTHALDIVILEQMPLQIAEAYGVSNNPVEDHLLFPPHVSHTVAPKNHTYWIVFTIC
jgi:hypothetical protein